MAGRGAAYIPDGCSCKIRYASYNQAKSALRYMQKKRRAQGRLTTYFCNLCKFWHLGH